MSSNENGLIDHRMLIVAECLANPAYQGTKDDIAREANISHTTLYRWLRNDEFIKKVNALVLKYASADLGMVYKALARECGKGNMQAIKLYLEFVKDSSVPTQDNSITIEVTAKDENTEDCEPQI